MSGFEVIIGCEIHCALRTATKAFCACENRAGGEPNTRVCPVCLGLPGTLPVPGRDYVALGVRAALAFGCEIGGTVTFDRKHYFYPDLPKGYQITQHDGPLGTGGSVEINLAAANDEPRMKKIRLERVHLEEDVGKSFHPEGAFSYIDFNRAGVPLVEIVSRPDLASPEEAALFMQAVREILVYAQVTDGSMEAGSLRCDANVNLKIIRNGVEYRTAISEIKNLNSFRSVRDACAFEAERQKREFTENPQVNNADFKNTMGWDEVKRETVFQRSKNSYIDYRYTPEPDIAPIRLSGRFLEAEEGRVGENPAAMRDRFRHVYGISGIEANTLTSDREFAEWFEEAAKNSAEPKKVCNWVLGDLRAVLAGKKIPLERLKVKPAHIAALADAVACGKITGAQAKAVFAEMLETGAFPDEIIALRGWAGPGDEQEIGLLVDKVLAENPAALADWKRGKTHVVGWLTGQVMKKSGGRANPARTTELVQIKLAQSL